MANGIAQDERKPIPGWTSFPGSGCETRMDTRESHPSMLKLGLVWKDYFPLPIKSHHVTKGHGHPFHSESTLASVPPSSVWTLLPLPQGQRLGPFQLFLTPSAQPPNFYVFLARQLTAQRWHQAERQLGSSALKEQQEAQGTHTA